MGKAKEISENFRNVIDGIGADFIDLVSYGNGVVIAKYPDQATMEAATDTAKIKAGKIAESLSLMVPVSVCLTRYTTKLNGRNLVGRLKAVAFQLPMSVLVFVFVCNLGRY